jgi:hypothetical protein
MANGKGSLDCVYCANYKKIREGIEFCSFHDVELPSRTCNNYVCGNFEASEEYWKTNDRYISPPGVRFSWFCKGIEAGLLYEFPYNSPQNAVTVFDLRANSDIENT